MSPHPQLPALPALVIGQVHHTRYRPIRHSFTHTAYSWLIDLDQPPRLPWWARPFSDIRGEDHLAGEPGLAALKDNAIRVLHREVADTPVSRVVMLTNARVLGHVFDPMTLFWCLAPDGDLAGVVVEVHNTYGERHAYALSGQEAADTTLDKAFYVSPFNSTEGSYAVRIRLSPSRVSASITLRVDGEIVLTATTTGRPRAVTPGVLARAVLTHPLMSHKISALIRVHGIWLWLRRLPVRSRPAHPQDAVA